MEEIHNFTWKKLKFWETGEYQVVQERLSDLDKTKTLYNPSKKLLFEALRLTPYDKTKVMFCGQDPYPDHGLATGLAFSIPEGTKTFPPTLNTIFAELESDLHIPHPKSGNLTKWAEEGVLLWNVVPSCLAGHSLSHDWYEWRLLTDEIINSLKERGVVFVFLGSRAKEHASLVRDAENCRVFETSHPSPRGQLSAKTPFRGSRIFSKMNAALVEIGLSPVDWCL